MKNRTIFKLLFTFSVLLIGSGCINQESKEYVSGQEAVEISHSSGNAPKSGTEQVYASDHEFDAIATTLKWIGKDIPDGIELITYVDDERGFSFEYPAHQALEAYSTGIGLLVEPISEMEENQDAGPQSRVSPSTQSENRDIAQHYKDGFFREYMGYIEGGALRIENVTFIDDVKVTLLFTEGDNSEYASALEESSRDELLDQYKKNEIDSAVLSERYNYYVQTVDSFLADTEKQYISSDGS